MVLGKELTSPRLIWYDVLMIRLNTRNFLLYLIAVGGLVIAIVALLAKDLSVPPSNSVAQVIFAGDPADEVVEYKAEVSEVRTLNRSENMLAMREKVAAYTLAEAPEPEPAAPEEVATDTPTKLASPLTCADYTLAVPTWPTDGLRFEVVEGARLVYGEVVAPVITPELPVVPAKQVYLQLPLRSSALAVKSCLPYDVIGIALDGSPIRNNEIGLYTIFGAETLIGYALDGFPLYGLGNSAIGPTDECGGAVVSGEYRYYLSEERETLIQCFSGVPVTL